MLSHPDTHLDLVRQRLDEARAHAADQRLARSAGHAWPDFVPPSRWRDGAFWASLAGPLIGATFLAYFAQQIAAGMAV
jgi:hypothetical protein